MLTRKQLDLLRFIQQRMRETGVPPSFDEMKDALDLKSKSGIHRLITALEERGFLRRLPNRARAIEVIRLPDTVTGPVAAAPAPAGHGSGSLGSGSFGSGAEVLRFNPSVVEGGRAHEPKRPAGIPAMATAPDENGQSVSVPVMGRIAAPLNVNSSSDHCAAVTSMTVTSSGMAPSP